MSTKKIPPIILHSLIQYMEGARWLRENIGKGKLWSSPPAWPYKSSMKWWAKAYGNMYMFWIKDPDVAILFRLALPSAIVYPDEFE